MAKMKKKVKSEEKSSVNEEDEFFEVRDYIRKRTLENQVLTVLTKELLKTPTKENKKPKLK